VNVDRTHEEDDIFTSLQALTGRPFESWCVSPNFPRLLLEELLYASPDFCVADKLRRYRFGVASGLVPDGFSPPCGSLKSSGVQSKEIRHVSPELPSMRVSVTTQGPAPLRMLPRGQQTHSHGGSESRPEPFRRLSTG